MSFLENLFGRRSRGFGRFGRSGRRQNALTRTFGNRRGGMALGTLAAIAAPFIMRKLRHRRAEHAYSGAY